MLIRAADAELHSQRHDTRGHAASSWRYPLRLRKAGEVARGEAPRLASCNRRSFVASPPDNTRS